MNMYRDSSANGGEESDVCRELRVQVSSLEDTIEHLKWSRALAEESYQKELGSLKDTLFILQSKLDDSEARHTYVVDMLCVELKKMGGHPPEMLLAGDNTDALSSVCGLLVNQDEHALVPGYSDVCQPESMLRSVPDVVPNLQPVIEAAVHAAAKKLLPAEEILYAVVDCLPDGVGGIQADVMENINVVVDTANVRNDGSASVDNNSELDGVSNKYDESDSDEESNSLIPEEWVAFSNDVEMLKVRLVTEPRVVLNHKHFGPHLQDLVKVRSTRSAAYFVSTDVVTTALLTATSYLGYAIVVFEDFFDRDVALLCACKDRDQVMSSFEASLAALPQEALDCFLDHCTSAAEITFGAQLSQKQLRLNVTRSMNEHLHNVRALIGLGPSPASFDHYRVAIHRAREMKIAY